LKSINRIVYCCFFFFFFFFSNCIFSQKLNRLNKHGHRTGKWITYIDEDKKIKSFEGRFRNGLSSGKCYFYTNDGVLDRREINRFKKMKTTFYYPNGMVKLKGNARIENLPDKVHYYFYGKWTAYNDSGALVKYQYYENGKLIKTEYLDKNIKINDSLIEVLNVIDKEFALHNTILTDSINSNLNNQSKKDFFEKQLNNLDSISFYRIGHIIDLFGYPSKEMVGESNSIPFYILSFAPYTIKEKYLNQLILAADRDFISWKSLAYFIDKLKIAKGEKQVYGTQGNYDKDYHFILYPCIDPENLDARRAKVGLEKLE
jgi:hypothetical protein